MMGSAIVSFSQVWLLLTKSISSSKWQAVFISQMTLSCPGHGSLTSTMFHVSKLQTKPHPATSFCWGLSTVYILKFPSVCVVKAEPIQRLGVLRSLQGHLRSPRVIPWKGWGTPDSPSSYSYHLTKKTNGSLPSRSAPTGSKQQGQVTMNRMFETWASFISCLVCWLS